MKTTFTALALFAGAVAPAFAQKERETYGGPGDRLGHALAELGDVNADGRPDFLASSVDAGYVVLSSGRNGAEMRSWSGATGDGFGFAIAGIDDASGDRLPDVAIGSPFADGARGTPDGGRVDVFDSVRGGLLVSAVGAIGDHLGYSVSSCGDLDGDRLGDVLIGAPELGTGDPGYIQVISSATGAILLQRPGSDPGDEYGFSVVGLGDVNRDGVPDVAAGAPGADSDRGLVEVISGRDGSLIRTLLMTSGGRFGEDLDSVDDFDGDGVREIVVGAPETDTASPRTGVASMYSGATGVNGWVFIGQQTDSRFGASVRGVGDLNGDGVEEVAVGAPNEDHAGGVDAGAMRVYQPRDGFVVNSFRRDEAGAHLGGALCSAGDSDGDGLAEMLVSAPDSSIRGGASGTLYLLGSGPLGLEMSPDVAALRDTVFAVSRGEPLQPYVLFLKDVNGIPVFRSLFVDTLDATGYDWISFPIVDTLGGIDLTFFTFSLDAQGKVIQSHDEELLLR